MKLFKILILLLLFTIFFVLLGGCVNKEIDYDNYGIEVLYREDGYVSKYTYQLIRREQKNALDCLELTLVRLKVHIPIYFPMAH